MGPSQLQLPTYLMNSPIAFENSEELKEKKVNFQKLLNQFFDLYNYIASESCIYLIPNISKTKINGLAVANIGNVLFDKNNQILLNKNNDILGEKFFDNLGYDISIISDSSYNGELNLRYIKDNVYIGGYWDKKSFNILTKISELYNIHINKLCLVDKNFPYLNNSSFVITKDYLLLCTKLYTKEEIKELEKYVVVEDVSIENCYQGACNSLRLFNSLINSSNIYDLVGGTAEYKKEIKKNRFLEDLAIDYGMELIQFNLSEFVKLDFWVSDLVLTLNNNSYLVDPF